VNQASRPARAAHLTFILFGVYLAILVGSTTHEQLMLGSRSKIPLSREECEELPANFSNSLPQGERHPEALHSASSNPEALVTD